MKVSVIGSGNVGTVLGRRVKAAGHEIVQVYSRSMVHAEMLANVLGCAFTDDLQKLKDADVFLITLSDAAIEGAAQKLGKRDALVLHTAGSVSIDVLQAASTRYGILYPLQSLRKEKVEYENIPLLINGHTEEDVEMIEKFARSLSDTVQRADDAYRLKLHVAAVFVSNFTNHLYSLAATYCEQEKVYFDLLKPLIIESATRLENYDPRQVQTGPAIRNDVPTLEKHLAILERYPTLKKIYQSLSTSIQRIHN